MRNVLGENKKLKNTIDEMMDIFEDSGLDYVYSDEIDDLMNDFDKSKNK